MYYVYILLCSDNSLYTGFTTDIKNRVTEHNRGKGSKYVRSRLPAKVVHCEEFGSKSEALKREIEIKKLSRGEKLKFINVDTIPKKKLRP